MALQKCLNCELEFEPVRDGCAHTFCSHKCSIMHRKKTAARDIAYRESLGLPQQSSFTSKCRTKPLNKSLSDPTL